MPADDCEEPAARAGELPGAAARFPVGRARRVELRRYDLCEPSAARRERALSRPRLVLEARPWR